MKTLLTRTLLTIGALLILAVCVSDADAGYWRRGCYYYYPSQVQAQAAAPVTAQTPAPVAQAPTARRNYSVAPSAAAPWPYYPNYGNPVGAAYSAAAGLREGQVYGTFGLRPAGARVRGNY